MSLEDSDIDELRKLEESLWVEATRFDPLYMDRVLAPEFFEFGRSGRIYSRRECLAVMSGGPIGARLPLPNFTVQELDANIALVTYRSEVTYDPLQAANRSSLWVRANNDWRLVFHQGTPANLRGTQEC